MQHDEKNVLYDWKIFQNQLDYTSLTSIILMPLVKHISILPRPKISKTMEYGMIRYRFTKSPPDILKKVFLNLRKKIRICFPRSFWIDNN